MINTLFALFKESKNIKLFIYLNIFVFIIYLIFQNIFTSLSIFSISLFSIKEKIYLFLINLFDLSSLKSIPNLILTIFFVLSISLFLFLIIFLYRKTGILNKNKGFWNSLWIFIAILGLSCVSCGIGLLASFLSFFGLSYIVMYFPLHGLEFGFLGLFFLNVSNYFLIKRLKNPFICN